jgi:co-chaperonin GroES (HSP10)
LQIKLTKLQPTKLTLHFFVKTIKSSFLPSEANFVITSNIEQQTLNQLMHITPDNKLKKLIVIGDRVLIKPTKPDEKTASGLYLPPGVQEKEKVQQGYVIKTGPGYAIPMPPEEEPWKQEEEKIKYVPLQAKEGDLAIFLVGGATEIFYQDEKYFIVPQSAILMLEREEEL